MRKYKISVFTVFILLAVMAFTYQMKPAQEGIHTTAGVKHLFADPPSEYRSAPLWDWNEQITEEGISFQLNEFKKAGIGGVFVHPRPGLITEYLSDEWFRLFHYTVQKGKELGMRVWIYDENSYPSGFAGGHVPAEMPDSYKHGAGLSLAVQQTLNVQLSDTIDVILKKTDHGFANITASAKQEIGQKGTYYIFKKTYSSKSPWYGGFSYVDLIYPGVTQKFIELTMTKGYEREIDEFGKTLPGSFSDEPNLRAAMGRGSVMRWTPDMWDAFQKRWNYDLRVNLPSLFDETGDWKKVRHDYYELLLELFVDRWGKPYSQYCEQKNLKWTGHYWEHGWPIPTEGFDEAAMYILHQQPGVDMLGNRLDTAGLGGQFGNDRAIRELRSAANQAGRTRTLSETYGGGGWEMKFETQKRLVDWEVVLGVNFVNQHLSYFSLNGVRKFDYPPSFSYHEPWWNYYRLMGNYIGRISMAMSSGRQINHTLVLQPNTTAWMYYSRKTTDPTIDQIGNGFKNFVYRLEQQHIEYDLGSESVLKTLGSAEDKLLKVGHCAYSLVVIPAEMENIDLNTFKLLKQYVANGGKVLAFRKDIPLLDGKKSQEVNELKTIAGNNWTMVQNLTDPSALGLLKTEGFIINDLTKNGMLYHQRRILDDGQLLFVVNSHPQKKASVEITLPGESVSLLDLVSGKTYRYPARSEKGKLTFKIDLEPAGSAMFSINKNKTDEPAYAPAIGTETLVEKTGGPRFKREDDNVLMVNYLDLKTDKSDKKGIYFMDALIDLFKENGIDMGNPWQHKIQYKKDYIKLDTLFKAGSWFEASYHFQVNPDLSAVAMKAVRAVVERPQLWKVLINGHEVTKLENSFWIDKQFPQYAVGPYLKPGENTLTIKAPRMNVLAEVMPVYLLGDFLVKQSDQGFEITGGTFNGWGSWREAGLPFYSQKVAYSQNFRVPRQGNKAFKVKLNRWNAPVAEVLVNGQKAGLIAWKPYDLDVSSLIKEGDNEITVRLTGSLKNTFGYFFSDNNKWIFSPQDWNYAPEKAPGASGYFLVDYGLMEPFDLVLVK
jgi:hypothetical protein